MADEADRAQAIVEQALEIALKNQKSNPKLRPVGRCRWCDETIREGLVCDADCRDDFEKSRKFRGIQ